MAADREPWGRQDGETSPAWEAFQAYRDLGADRSLQKTADKLGKHASQLKKWSTTHQWAARIAAFERHEDELQQQRIRARRRRSLDRRLDLSDKAFTRVEEALDGADASKWRAGDLARVIAETARLEDSVLDPAGKPGARGHGAEPLTADDFDHLTDEEIAAQLVMLRRELDAELNGLASVLGRVPEDQRDSSTVALLNDLASTH